MLTIYTTEVFDRWFAALKDKQAAEDALAPRARFSGQRH
jgi:putative component of toxin-antitoxin plasmid stabilization module